MDAAPSATAPQTVAANLRTILRGLLAELGNWRLEPVFAVLLYGRIGGIAGRIERMLTRFRAGRLWRATHRARAQGRCGHMAGRGPALPRRFGWLVRAGGHQAASFGTQLQAVLNAPEMAELLAASAQARRILRPLCRALAVDMPGIVAEPPRPAIEGDLPPQRRKRPRPAREALRIPLPRGVLSAARREGFGKDR